MPTRTFTPEQLDAIGVPYDLPTNADTAPEGAAIELHDEQVESRRWESVNELVFRAPDDGKAYRVYYRAPLTEIQESDPWNDEREVEAVEVEQRQVTVTNWVPVTDAGATP